MDSDLTILPLSAYNRMLDQEIEKLELELSLELERGAREIGVSIRRNRKCPTHSELDETCVARISIDKAIRAKIQSIGI